MASAKKKIIKVFHDLVKSVVTWATVLQVITACQNKISMSKTGPAVPLEYLKLEPGYTSDAHFKFRPVLKTNKDPKFKDLFVEISEDGISWRSHQEFIPDAPGVFYARVKAVNAEGEMAYSPIGAWRPQQKHFIEQEKILVLTKDEIKVTKKSKFSSSKIKRRVLAQAEKESQVAPPPVILEDTTIVTKDSEKKNWIYEYGLGGSYLHMKTSSALVDASSEGFSGPGFYLGLEK